MKTYSVIFVNPEGTLISNPPPPSETLAPVVGDHVVLGPEVNEVDIRTFVVRQVIHRYWSDPANDRTHHDYVVVLVSENLPTPRKLFELLSKSESFPGG